MSSQLTKTQLRRQLLQMRRSIPATIWREKSDHLCQNLQNLGQFKQAKTILAYFTFCQEPDLSPLFILPRKWGFSRCVDQSLVWHLWQPKNFLKTGIYGIPEPAADAPIITPKEVDLIFLPAIACDHQGYRLGYGGGFYDRMFSDPQWTNIFKIGIIFDFAYLPQLPFDVWDQALDGVCTESGYISF
jgi:5-formyltetrahydrofolate cyclo-ligase